LPSTFFRLLGVLHDATYSHILARSIVLRAADRLVGQPGSPSAIRAKRSCRFDRAGINGALPPWPRPGQQPRAVTPVRSGQSARLRANLRPKCGLIHLSPDLTGRRKFRRCASNAARQPQCCLCRARLVGAHHRRAGRPALCRWGAVGPGRRLPARPAW
jgi:hypothetical protein